ncbi:MAG: hypothetical protein HYV42_01370 [Candidatus Magasanikbacteria bacterium]|nr:hypothetical protein [Candidatus Magasanikbacteria bacterium]
MPEPTPQPNSTPRPPPYVCPPAPSTGLGTPRPSRPARRPSTPPTEPGN